MFKRKALVTTLAVAVALGGLAVRQAVQAQGEGGAKLTTQDYIDIEQLYARYTHALDSGNGKAWGETFTQDGQMWSDTALSTYPNYTLNGRDAIAAYVKGPARERPRVGHVNSNLVITPTATGATGRVYLLLYNLETTSEGWRFKKRSHHGAVAKPAAPTPSR
jgi:hypothetical protein